MFRPVLVSAVLAFSPSIGWAHEFWLSPEAYEVDPGALLEVRLRVGEEFRGASYVFNPARFSRFSMITGANEAAIEGRVGDDPALSQIVSDEGLLIVVHETEAQTLTYRDWDRFVGFVTHKGHDDAVARHASRELPQTGFKESYRRYAKSLIAVGNAAGSDREMGMQSEIVALDNPYRLDPGQGMRVQVLLNGAPRAGAQVEVFERDLNGDVSIAVYSADANGQARITVQPGRTYLVDSVVLRDLEPTEEGDPVWESLWASLTFRVP